MSEHRDKSTRRVDRGRLRGLALSCLAACLLALSLSSARAQEAPFEIGLDLGQYPSAIALTPDGSRAYVVNTNTTSITVINTLTNELEGGPIYPGGLDDEGEIIPGTETPEGIAISPDGSHAYVANTGSDNVSIID